MNTIELDSIELSILLSKDTIWTLSTSIKLEVIPTRKYLGHWSGTHSHQSQSNCSFFRHSAFGLSTPLPKGIEILNPYKMAMEMLRSNLIPELRAKSSGYSKLWISATDGSLTAEQGQSLLRYFSCSSCATGVVAAVVEVPSLEVLGRSGASCV